MNVLDLFSGIGGFSLGLEQAGMTTVAFCENNPYCRKILAKHWPEVPVYDDVRTLNGRMLAADGIEVDLICGGFPCQDISVAGSGEGLAGKNSGLWSEFARLVGEIRPKYTIVENVAALKRRGLDRVLGDLAAFGYDARWDCIPASAIGAPHQRDRIWIVAYPGGGQLRHQPGRGGRTNGSAASKPADHGPQEPVADTNLARLEGRNGGRLQERAGELPAGASGAPVADTGRTVGRGSARAGWRGESTGDDPPERRRDYREADVQWLTEPGIRRVADGVPARVDRLKSLGNSLVPQIPEMLGQVIMELECQSTLPRPPR